MNLTLNDITGMVNFIDVSVKRGIIQGSEITQVAQLRERLVAFAEAATAAQSPEAAPLDAPDEGDVPGDAQDDAQDDVSQETV